MYILNANNTNNIKWVTILLQVVIMASLLNSQVIVSGEETTKLDASQAGSIIPHQIGGPVIENPIITPSNPSPSDTPTVDVIISDTDGISDAKLFWEYNSNSTLFNTTMGTSDTLINQNDDDFIREGFIDGSGNEITDQSTTDWWFVDYIYDIQQISSMDLSVNKAGQIDVVYVRVEILNITTQLWEEVDLDGTVGGTANINYAGYTLNQLVSGVRIYIITERGNGSPDRPNLTVDLFTESYTADILANNVPAFVDYYIVANDTTGLITTSPTYTVLMDNTPIVTIDALPPGTSNDVFLNVSVFDLDGEATIDQSSVIAYFRPVNDPEWQSVNLDFQLNFGGAALFTVTIPLTGSGETETVFEIMVNATDTVGLLPGYTGSSGVNTITLDNLGPRLTNLIFKPGTFSNNATSVDSEVDLTTIFVDNSGIKNASIYYSDVNSANFNTIAMTNTTFTGINTPSSSYNVTLPASEISGFVDYYFELTDFLGNTRQTSVNRYFPDGEGPQVLEEFLIFNPTFISNITDVNMLFNATDIAGVQDVTVWYTYNGSVWDSVQASQINYNNIELPRQVFDASKNNDFPLLIKNADVTKIDLNIKRLLDPQDAILYVDITHERSSDIRLWLSLTNGKRVLIYDRVLDGDLGNVEVSLFDLGFTLTDFDNNNFTLEIEDINSLYSGFINGYSIELIQYELPYGYEYLATIPRSEQNADVLVFVTLTDNLNNVVNSSQFTYHSDGLPPEISVTEIEGPLKLDKKAIKIQATVTDGTGISEVELYYRFSENDTWSIIQMSNLEENDLYSVSVPLTTSEGNVTYYVRAFDQVGLSARSDEYSVEYSVSEDDDLIRIVLIVSAGLIAIAGLSYLVKAGKLKLPKRKRSL